jgi:cell division septation protein DedD
VAGQTRGDSAKADSAKADSAKTRAPGRSAFQVQVAAIATASGAEDAARKTRALGFRTVTVKDKGLYKVRASGFATRAEAQAAAARIKARLGGSPFVIAGS